jgi:carbon-monoxide dehydrogenase small subunit
MKIHCRVNGREATFDVPPMLRLLDALRDELHLTGSKLGCGEGECGACSVLMDGELVLSCLVPSCQAEGKEILTIEGLAPDGVLAPVQQAFLEHGGAQCGICTPGMVMAAEAYLRGGGNEDQAAIREALEGNLCRCTGYVRILESVVQAVKLRADRTATDGEG